MVKIRVKIRVRVWFRDRVRVRVRVRNFRPQEFDTSNSTKSFDLSPFDTSNSIRVTPSDSRLVARRCTCSRSWHRVFRWGCHNVWPYSKIGLTSAL